MLTIKLTVHTTGQARCLLSGREQSEGLTVTFEDGTVRESHLSWKAFRQLLALKTAQNGKPSVSPPLSAAATTTAPKS